MSELASHSHVKQGTERNFGVVFGAVFGLIGLYPLLAQEGVRLWALAIAAVFFVLAFFAPRALSIPNKLWFKFGMLLGAIIAPIVMVLIYAIAVVPVGLALRLFGKDLLRVKLDKKANTYWIERSQPVGPMRDQF